MAIGRPRFETTAARRRKVEKMASTGMSRAEIAILIGCSRHTLARHFGEELARGDARYRRDLGLRWGRPPSGAILWLERRMSERTEGRSAAL